MALSFPTGYQVATAKWLLDAFGWALMDATLTPAPTGQVHLSDIVAAEYAAGGYARQALAGAAVVVDVPGLLVHFQATGPDFGVLTGGAIASWLVLFHNAGSDATDEIVAIYPMDYTADSSTDCLIVLAAGDAIQLPMSCPAELTFP
jgi:hypothetical protein